VAEGARETHPICLADGLRAEQTRCTETRMRHVSCRSDNCLGADCAMISNDDGEGSELARVLLPDSPLRVEAVLGLVALLRGAAHLHVGT
jgi:hypothetical protein